MLRIRKQHIDAFTLEAFKNFESRFRSHARKKLAKYCSTINDEELAALVGEGIQQARNYGFVLERHICLYIDLMILVGRKFDTEEWAKKILAKMPLQGQEVALRALFEAARRNRHDNAVFGP